MTDSKGKQADGITREQLLKGAAIAARAPGRRPGATAAARPAGASGMAARKPRG